MKIGPPTDPTYQRIVCSVGVGPGPREAVHKALSLWRPRASLLFVAARQDSGRDPTGPRDLSEMQARGALELALDAARSAQVEASASLLRGRPVEELLIASAQGADLLVLAGSIWLRRGATSIDPLAMRIATGAPCNVLVANPRPLLMPGGPAPRTDEALRRRQGSARLIAA
jgi:nucleotide-binding universal stress UspA family protein